MEGNIAHTPEQRRLAAKLLAIDSLTDEQIAQQCGIGVRILYKWKRQPTFTNQINQYLEQPPTVLMQPDREDELAAVSATVLARHRFRDFVRAAHPLVNRRTAVQNWHLDVIAEHLQAVCAGEIKRLLITMPPRHEQLTVFQTLWPAWQWLRKPSWRAIVFTHRADALGRCCSLVNSNQFKATFSSSLKARTPTKWRIENDETGYIVKTDILGQHSGWRGESLIIADPLDPKRAHPESEWRRVIELYRLLSTNLNNGRDASIVVVMSRGGKRDLANHILQEGSYEHLNLPAEYQPERAASYSARDPRTERGASLCPTLVPKATLTGIKRRMGEQLYAAAYQQCPTECGPLKRELFRYWQKPGPALSPVIGIETNGRRYESPLTALPGVITSGVQSWIFEIRGPDRRGRVVGQSWVEAGGKFYLVDFNAGTYNAEEAIRIVATFQKRWPKLYRLIDDQSSEKFVLQRIAMMGSVIPAEKCGSEQGRVANLAWLLKSGGIYFPHPQLSHWVNGFADACIQFPGGGNDGIVDGMTSALSYLTKNVRGFWA